MRVAERQGGDPHPAGPERDLVELGRGRREHRDLAGQEARQTHVHPHRSVLPAIQADEPREGLDDDGVVPGVPAVLEVTRHAARAVAAVSDLAAVGIEDPIAGRDAVTLCRLEQEDLIAADAEPPVGQPAHLCRRRYRWHGPNHPATRSRCRGHASW